MLLVYVVICFQISIFGLLETVDIELVNDNQLVIKVLRMIKNACF